MRGVYHRCAIGGLSMDIKTRKEIIYRLSLELDVSVLRLMAETDMSLNHLAEKYLNETIKEE